MAKYRPPHGMLDFLLAGSKTARKYTRENDDYRRAWHRERARNDYRR